jgi:tetratricopeptide (TPR) repeat protein
MIQPSVSTDCHLLPEMVDDAMGQLASQGGDVRAAVAEARRVAELLRGQGSAREDATPQGPAWPVEPGSLSEIVYWYRRTAGLGNAPEPAEVAASLSNLAHAWRGERRWDDAETALRECLQLRQQHGDRAGIGQTLIDLGALFQAQERWADAERPLSQGLEIAREIGDRRGAGNALGNLGVVYAALGQAEKAIGHLQEAMAVANEIADEALAERMAERLTRINRSQS